MKETEILGLNFWKPKEIGDQLVGTVMKIDNDAKYGTAVTIKTTTGDEYLTPAHAWLQSLLKRVDVGNNVKIVYDGENPPLIRGQSPTQKYKLFRLSED